MCYIEFLDFITILFKDQYAVFCVLYMPGVHNSETSKSQIININCCGLQSLFHFDVEILL